MTELRQALIAAGVIRPGGTPRSAVSTNALPIGRQLRWRRTEWDELCAWLDAMPAHRLEALRSQLRRRRS